MCVCVPVRGELAVGPPESTDPPLKLVSRFHFVDLAGSERQSKTNGACLHRNSVVAPSSLCGRLTAAAGANGRRACTATGDRFLEGRNINLSLFTLSRVVQALADSATHVPYRESELTKCGRRVVVLAVIRTATRMLTDAAHAALSQLPAGRTVCSQAAAKLAGRQQPHLDDCMRVAVGSRHLRNALDARLRHQRPQDSQQGRRQQGPGQHGGF